jgi:hypothetical protein
MPTTVIPVSQKSLLEIQPRLILTEVLLYVTVHDLAALAQCSWTLYNATNNEKVWRTQFEDMLQSLPFIFVYPSRFRTFRDRCLRSRKFVAIESAIANARDGDIVRLPIGILAANATLIVRSSIRIEGCRYVKVQNKSTGEVHFRLFHRGEHDLNLENLSCGALDVESLITSDVQRAKTNTGHNSDDDDDVDDNDADANHTKQQELSAEESKARRDQAECELPLWQPPMTLGNLDLDAHVSFGENFDASKPDDVQFADVNQSRSSEYGSASGRRHHLVYALQLFALQSQQCLMHIYSRL